ncbi:MAG: Na+/H+ antiporter NhaA [Gammaproteobacteria bacterium]|jgi:NhaA family Na+:H+ antiporter|nr:Na+/H+ antiporter NhaA [Gammaproteobacteria bacterium]
MTDRLLKAFQEFVKLEAAGGLVLMAAAVIAMIVANSPVADGYLGLLAHRVTLGAGALVLSKPLLLWINDGLMAVFFLLVGMELKREVLEGHLGDLRRAGLPAIAAVGGMAVPAAIYLAFNAGDPVAMRGWAIPSATDIAFALGVLALLGNRVPVGLKAFLLSVAIFDDLGAIVIIALFYTAELSVTALLVAAGAIAVLAVLNRLRVLKVAPYLAVGAVLWIAVLKSGVHATLAGVVVAMFIPMRGAASAGEDASPLRELEHALHPWVAFGILPIFAFANAGVPVLHLSFTDLFQPVPLGIALGLLAGKFIGILGLSWAAVKLGLGSLPKGVDWPQMAGMSLLAGIGFTMSLFIASLAFEAGAVEGLERLGILCGSLLAGLLGYLVLRAALGRSAAT